ncbi:MAG TPA: hypothetical protein VFP68_07230 [Burkholderiaceae bacterium]|nr:hypothetical protein [Burkholderiaceae bacterium]
MITIPTFPSLDEIFNQIKNEICRIASEQVHQAVGNVGLAINAAMRNVPTYGGPSAIATPGVSVHSTSTMPAAITPPASSTTTGGSDFWSSIWR